MKFTINVEMKDRWVPHFLSMLKHIEYLGNIGASREIAIYADGDGDFQPKFKFDVDYEEMLPVRESGGNRLYDAG